MSNQAINRVLALRMRSSDKFVLLCMANYADEQGRTWPSIATLESDTCLDRKTIIAAIGRLREKGFITDTGERGGATKSVPVYEIATEPPESGKQSQNRNSSVFPRKQSRFSAPSSPVFPKNPKSSPTPPSISVEPLIEPLRNPKRARARVRASPASHFGEWWQEYPRKVGKLAAEKSYLAAIARGASEAALLEAARKQRATGVLDGGKFCPHPTTWLNQGRWLDERQSAEKAMNGFEALAEEIEQHGNGKQDHPGDVAERPGGGHTNGDGRQRGSGEARQGDFSGLLGPPNRRLERGDPQKSS